jgi:hypothetical protein
MVENKTISSKVWYILQKLLINTFVKRILSLLHFFSLLNSNLRLAIKQKETLTNSSKVCVIQFYSCLVFIKPFYHILNWCYPFVKCNLFLHEKSSINNPYSRISTNIVPLSATNYCYCYNGYNEAITLVCPDASVIQYQGVSHSGTFCYITINYLCYAWLTTLVV